ncbi:hypothetical protein BRD00_11520 [Halobacteriales archaeon QS_8_69_26]|nr:MAG: hypothetical protein BRD00_11520 [Halobacteriales archaeon QS_8_69_26]
MPPAHTGKGMDAGRAKTVAVAVYREIRRENLTFMAGSIAYHAFVSLLPLMVLLVVTLDSVGERTLVEAVLATTESVLTTGGRRILTESLGAGREVSGVSLLGLALLLWATLRIFRGLDQAFSDVYETERRNTLPDQVLDGAVVLVVVVLAILAVATVRGELTFSGPVGVVLGGGFVVAALTVVFLPMYYVFPDEDHRILEVLPGTVLAAAGVTLLESLFRFYVEFSSTTDYGVLGGMVVLVTWLYFNGLVVLLGAVLNAVLTDRTEDVDVDPVIGAGRPDAGGDARPEAALGSRLEKLRERIRAGSDLTVAVAGEGTTLPAPDEVAIDADRGDDGVGITLRWTDGAATRATDGGGTDPASVAETDAGSGGGPDSDAGSGVGPDPDAETEA